MLSIFDYKHIKDSIVTLTENYTIKIKDLSKYQDLYKSYEYINLFLSVTDRSESYIELYNSMIDIILKQYRPSIIYPETVGSFLFGCFQRNYGDIDSLCSPLCSNSIKNDLYSSEVSCQNQIWLQVDHSESLTIESRFSKLGSKCRSLNAYIYVDKSFDGFTLSEINYFKRFGVEKAQVMLTDNLKHHIIHKMSSIVTLPLISNYEGVNTSYTIEVKSTSKMDGDVENNNLFLITFSVAFVLIMIISIYNKSN